MIKKLLFMIAICAVCVSLTVMTGCGSKQETDGESGQTEAAEQAESHEPNPYIDGMTLEEAQGELATYGSVFIKSGGLFYPMVKAKNLCPSGLYDGDHAVYLIKAKEENLVRTLENGDQIVEVYGEADDGAFELLSGRQGYTANTVLHFDSVNGEHKLVSSGSTESVCEKINGAEIDSGKLTDFAVNALDENSEKQYNEYIKGKNPSEFDAGVIKMANWNLHSISGTFTGVVDSRIECILDLEKGETAALQWRQDGDAEAFSEQYTANYKYYNLPDQFEEAVYPAEDNTTEYELEYTPADDGYLILNTEDLPAGTYAYKQSNDTGAWQYKIFIKK